MSVESLRKIIIYTLLLFALAVICAPAPSESRRVIFYAPRQMQLLTGQILATGGKEEPCEKCHMRDHRGHCRRIISYNADGIKC